MAYNRTPPARTRFTEDEVLPPEPLTLVWPTIAWLVGFR